MARILYLIAQQINATHPSKQRLQANSLLCQILLVSFHPSNQSHLNCIGQQVHSAQHGSTSLDAESDFFPRRHRSDAAAEELGGCIFGNAAAAEGGLA